MKNLIAFHHASKSASEFADGYLQYLIQLLLKIDTQVIEDIVDCFLSAVESDNIIYFIGNGGCAATASHFASDLALNTRAEGRKPFRAVSLTDNQAVVTCLANDEGFDTVFVRQLEYLLRPNDILVALSVSGNSPNVVKAVEYAKDHQATVITCTGFNGGKIAQMADIAFHVPTPEGEYGPVEDIFQILDHLLYTYLRLNRVGKLAH